MRVNFKKGSVGGVGFITITCMGGMRGDGLMESMMGMVLRHGLEGAGIEGNIEKV